MSAECSCSSGATLQCLAGLRHAGTALHTQRLGEGGHTAFLQLPAEVDQLGSHVLPTRAVEQCRIALLERQHIAQLGEVLGGRLGHLRQTLVDALHVTGDVADVRCSRRHDEPWPHHTLEMPAGIGSGGLDRGRLQPIEPKPHRLGRLARSSGSAQCVGSEPRQVLAGGLHERVEPCLGPRRTAGQFHHLIGGDLQAFHLEVFERHHAHASDGETRRVGEVLFDGSLRHRHGEQRLPRAPPAFLGDGIHRQERHQNRTSANQQQVRSQELGDRIVGQAGIGRRIIVPYPPDHPADIHQIAA